MSNFDDSVMIFFHAFFIHGLAKKNTTLPETHISPENRPPGKGDSYWKTPFLGANCR